MSPTEGSICKMRILHANNRAFYVASPGPDDSPAMAVPPHPNENTTRQRVSHPTWRRYTFLR